MGKDELQEIKEYLSNKRIIREPEFRDNISTIQPDLEKNYRSLLSRFYKDDILYRYDTGVLKLCNGKKEFTFTLPLTEEIKNKLETIEPSVIISTWQLADLNMFMSLQSFDNIIFIETYSYAHEIVLDMLLDSGVKVVLEKDYSTYIKYNFHDNIYMIRKINDESPIVRQSISNKEKTHIVAPKIEKIIVDIIVDRLFDVILADETSNILRELLSNYKINIATIKRYATKRHNWPKVKFAIESIGFNLDEGEF